MSKKLVVLAVVACAVPFIATVVSFYGSEGALIERFSDHDPKLVVKANREIFRETLKGQHADATEEQLDSILLLKIMHYQLVK